MDNLLRAERYKLFHRFTYWIGLAVMFAFGFISAKGYIDDGMYFATTSEPVPVSSFSGLFNCMAADSLILVVIVTGILSLIIGMEFHKRTMSSEVASGHKRSEIIFSKIMVNTIAYNVIMLAFPYAGIIKAVIYYGTGNLLDNILNILRTSAYMVLAYTAIFAFAILLAFLFKNGVVAGIVTTIICFAMTYAFAISCGSTGLAFVFVLPFYHFRKALEVGSSIDGDQIINVSSLIVCSLWIAICVIITWRKFAKSDLK
ncbi:MAG: ABC transporter permease [Lachnospiraceae bacterium]|nr:ABC transporter permease [Lachnospiraceae bacterium]